MRVLPRPALQAQIHMECCTLLRYLNILHQGTQFLTLSCKLITLLLLLSGQRAEYTFATISDVECDDTQLILRFNALLKQSRPGTHVDEIALPAYSEPGLCVVRTLKPEMHSDVTQTRE